MAELVTAPNNANCLFRHHEGVIARLFMPCCSIAHYIGVKCPAAVQECIVQQFESAGVKIKLSEGVQ